MLHPFVDRLDLCLEALVPRLPLHCAVQLFGCTLFSSVQHSLGVHLSGVLSAILRHNEGVLELFVLCEPGNVS